MEHCKQKHWFLEQDPSWWGRWDRGMREQYCCSAQPRKQAVHTSCWTCNPDQLLGPEPALSELGSSVYQNAGRNLYHWQNCIDHKQYIYFFSWTDEKMFSGESSETVSNYFFFLSRGVQIWTHADNGSRLFKSNLFNTFKICVLLPYLQGIVYADRSKP